MISLIEFIVLIIMCVVLFKKAIFDIKGFRGIINMIIVIILYGIIRVLLGKFINI